MKTKYLFIIINIFLAILIMPSFLNAATYYVDATSGNDSNTGLSAALAWKTITKVNTIAFNPGDQILFKKGETFPIIYNSYWILTGMTNLTISSYGTGVLPILDALENIDGAGGWTYNGGNVWSKTIALTKRVWLDGVETLEADTPSEVGAKWKWCWDTNKLYVYSVTNNPDTTYSSILVNRIPYCILLTGVKNSTISSIELRGGCSAGIYMTGDSQGNTIDRNNFTYGWDGVKGASNATSGAEVAGLIKDNVISNNYFNAYYGVSYSGADYDFTDMAAHDAISFLPHTQNNTVKNNTIINFGHSGFSLEGLNISGMGHQGNIFEYNDISGPNSPYLRGFGVSGTVGQTVGNIIRYNNIHDCNVRSQIGGNGNKFYYNLFINTSETPRKASASQGVAFQGWLTDATYVCHDNLFYNNTIVNSHDEGILVDATYPTKNLIKNNIVANCGTGNSNYQVVFGSAGAYIVISNNLFYSIATNNTIRYKGKEYTVVNADANSGEFSNNLLSSPLFVSASNFHLQSTSPAINAGVYVGLTLDYDGNTIRNPPNIGAYDNHYFSLISPKGFEINPAVE